MRSLPSVGVASWMRAHRDAPFVADVPGGRVMVLGDGDAWRVIASDLRGYVRHAREFGSWRDAAAVALRTGRAARVVNPAAFPGRLQWRPLFVDGHPSSKIRELVRGRAGVYLLKQNGILYYVGSSVWGESAPGRHGRTAEKDPRRFWKTILRHFQSDGPHVRGHYAFGSDNWTAEPADDWMVAVHLTPRAQARDAEAIAISRFVPEFQKIQKTIAYDPGPVEGRDVGAFDDLLGG